MDQLAKDVERKVLNYFKVEKLSSIPEADHTLAVQMTIFYLTRRIHSGYNYGLSQKMFKENFDVLGNFKWILKDYDDYPEKGNLYTASFNFTYFDQRDHVKVHRSGWQNVYNSIVQYSSDSRPDLIKLDMSIDRTFHWDAQVLNAVGVLPYSEKWCGFLHHTFDTEFSDYNSENLFKNTLFLESLKTCKGIFVLSEYLRGQVLERLKSVGHPDVAVITMFHPTELQCSGFERSKFESSAVKQIVHIGGWLRNTNTFYKLNVPGGVQKTLLKGKQLGNYLPSTVCVSCSNGSGHILPQPVSCSTSPSPASSPCKCEKCKGNSSCSTSPSSTSPCKCEKCRASVSCSTSPSTSTGQCVNRFEMILQKDIRKMIESVHVVEDLNDSDYDMFLKDKVVFLNLTDASACNTLIECMARCVPIIVNRLPALEEYVGSEYPLFYKDGSSQFEIDKFVEKVFKNGTILKAHRYLALKSKEKLIMSEFIQKLLTTIRIIDRKRV